jgi:hypothetical protein
MIDALPRPLAHLARQLIVAVPLCSFVALFLGSAFNEPLGRMFVFSFSIGLTCQLLIEGCTRICSRANEKGPPIGGPGLAWMP